MQPSVDLDKLRHALAEALLAFPADDGGISLPALRLKRDIHRLLLAVEKMLLHRARSKKR